MRIYECDACGETIENPYAVKMKEFYVGVDLDEFGGTPARRKAKRKVHLCQECFEGLYLLARKKQEEI